MNEHPIKERLVEHGNQLFQAPKEFIRFTRHDEADALLNNLDEYPLMPLFLLALWTARLKPKEHG